MQCDWLSERERLQGGTRRFTGVRQLRPVPAEKHPLEKAATTSHTAGDSSTNQPTDSLLTSQCHHMARRQERRPLTTVQLHGT